MLLACLVGAGGWSLKRCRLTWRLRGTRYRRLYFQLAPSAHPTDGTGYGLLPTPLASEPGGVPQGSTFHGTHFRRPDGSKVNSSTALMAVHGLLPTPTAMESIGKPRPIFKKGNSWRYLSNQNVEGGAKLVDLMGAGFLPTPTAVQREHPERVAALKASGAQTMASRRCGETRPNSILDAVNFYGLLPTPKAQSANAPGHHGKGGMDLQTFVAESLLPTPTATSDPKGGSTGKDPARQSDTLAHMVHGLTGEPGKTSQLNPRFVGEMMGFPPGWTESPFLNGEGSP
jgi:hypothetical protein